MALRPRSHAGRPPSDRRANHAGERAASLFERYAKRLEGSASLAKWLTEQGEAVNRKRVQRLMRLMGLEAIYPKPKLSAARAGHRIYPYLLRNVRIERADQVWSTDITYVPLASGFMYLAAIIDWFSRYVLA